MLTVATFGAAFGSSPPPSRAAGANMNGPEPYEIANRPASGPKYSTENRDYAGGVEYFDVWSPPITTLYSQVWWTMMKDVPLPADVVSRFDGKVMAVTGMEQDQVMVACDSPPCETPDVSVPITWAYNHHYGSYVYGKGSGGLEKVKLTGPHDPRNFMGHPMPHNEMWLPKRRAENDDSKYPAATVWAEGNGGESRKSYHSFPPPYAQLVESPVSWAIQPMQIDTQNRDGSMSEPGMPFTPGPHPIESHAPVTGPDSIYSGLLECPCTDRITRKLGHGAAGAVVVKVRGACGVGAALRNASTCASVARTALAAAMGNAGEEAAGMSFTFAHGKNATMPPGCSLVVRPAAAVMHAAAFWNTDAASTVPCGPPSSATSLIVEGTHAFTSLNVSVAVHLDAKANVATITLQGPSGKWFGVGFDASSMASLPYAIVVDGAGKLSEHKLGKEEAGTTLQPFAHVVSSTLNATSGLRTVIATRPLAVDESYLRADYYSFAPTTTAISIIAALGSGGAFSYHQAKDVGTLALVAITPGSVAEASPTCLCGTAPPAFGDTADGTIIYTHDDGTAESIGFGKRCTPKCNHTLNPNCTMSGDLIEDRNPTCDVRYYQGGLRCCHHKVRYLRNQLYWRSSPT